MSLPRTGSTTQVRSRPEGGGGFALVLRFDGTVAPVARRKSVGRAGANRAASDAVKGALHV